MATDAEIIESAARIFREKGYHAASMQDIAHAVGLLKGSLYHHISSKQQLLLEILESGMRTAIGAIEEIAFADLPPADKLRLAITRHIELIAGNLDQATVSIIEARALKPEQRQRVLAQRDRFEGLFRHILQEGIDAGVFRPADSTLITFALMGMHNWLILWYREDGRRSPKEIAAIFADTVLNGLLVRE